MKMITLLFTVLTTVLTCGLFFTWSVSIIPGLSKLTNNEYLASMQSINREIQNPVFLLCFLGAAIALPVCTYLHYHEPMVFRLLFAASLLYLIGVLGVTVAGNIPMNEALDAFDLKSASPVEIADRRTLFEGPWNQLNHIRATASALALIAAITACLYTKP